MNKVKYSMIVTDDVRKYLKTASNDFTTYGKTWHSLNRNFFNLNIMFWPHTFNFKKKNNDYEITVLNGDKNIKKTISKDLYFEKIVKPSVMYCNEDYTYISGDEKQINRFMNFIADNFGKESIKLIKK